MTTPYSKRKPNKRGEFLLDVTPTHDGRGYFIYDVTMYLESRNGLDRQHMLKQARFSIKGKKYTIHVIDQYESLNHAQCISLVKHWYTNADDDYRLD